MLLLKELLERLGWTSYEASAYCTIVESGPIKANDLAIKAKIPTGRVYEVLTTLTNKGWLKKTGTRPVKYDAQHPRLVLDLELDQLQGKMTESLRVSEQAWEVRNEQIGDKDDKSWTVAGMHGVILEIRNLFDKTKKSIKIVESSLTWLTSRDFRKLEELIGKKVSISVVATEACKDELQKLSNLKSEVSVSSKPDVPFYIIDDEVVLLRLNSPDTGNIIQDVNVAKMFIAKFNQINKTAKKMEVDKVAD